MEIEVDISKNKLLWSYILYSYMSREAYLF